MRVSFRPFHLLAACMALVWLLMCLPVQATDIDARLQTLMEEHGTVGLAVVVVRDNAVVYRNSLGWKDRDARVPLAEGDLFRIASISKSFAAVSVLQLVERGKLSLDDDVGGLLGFPVRNPAFPDHPITLAMLLNHTSSITDPPRYGSLDVINPGVDPTWAQRYAGRAPGSQYEYSNLGYNMVGTIVERVSGQRYDAYVKQHVLDPLGLHAGFLPDALDPARIARIYRWDEGKQDFVRSEAAYAPLGARLDDYRLGYDAPMFSPTGGLKISASDLATWMLVHMNHGEWSGTRVVSAAHARAMQAATARIDADSAYAMALRTDGVLVPGEVLTGHTGSAYGLYSSMFFDVQRKYGFVVITNGTRDENVRTEVNRALYTHFIAQDAAASTAN